MDHLNVSTFENEMILREMEEKDLDEIVRIARLGFDNPEIAFEKKHYESHIRIFPEGQICVEYNGQIIGSSSSLIVNYDDYGDDHSIDEISGQGYITNHNPRGKHLYGIDVVVHPDYRHLKIGRRLYEERRKLCKKFNLKSIIFGGRIPNYHQYADRMTAEEYVEQVKDQHIYDPVLVFQLINGFEIRGVLPGYLKEDNASLQYATLLEWKNPDYVPEGKQYYHHAEPVRISNIQYPLTKVESFSDFARRCEHFINSCSKVRSDFVILPEHITLQLLSFCKEKVPSKQVRSLTDFTNDYLELFSNLAIRYSINILAGSQFVEEGNSIYSVSFMFHRHGKIDRQYKLHIPTRERKRWGVKPGRSLHVFDTDKGKAAMLTGYDLMFPELARMAVDQGAVMLFSPFSATEEQGCWRTRVCAQARAIENEVYVSIAGLSGHMPDVERTDVFYSLAGIYSPVDIPFSGNGVVAESELGQSAIIHGEIDVEKLRTNRINGTVTPLKDRVKELYQDL